MSTTALVIIGLALLVIVAILLFGGKGRSGRRIEMISLANESRDRYLADWDRIEMRFVDAPAEAVREADALVMSVLRERRHSLDERMLPGDVREARRDASIGKGDQTEAMRRALLHYRVVMEKMVGAPVHPTERDREGRREMA
ncbi:MAG: hypothetical protein ACYDAL_12400 [Candidatus Dormibacteraceae bacterium]